MEPILSKEEIKDLLSAVKTGKVSTDNVGVGTSSRFLAALSAREIDLCRVYIHDQDKGETRIPNLDIILDVFARHFATSLTNKLQRNFTVERGEIETTTFQNSLAQLNNKGAIGIYNTDPLKYGCLFHLNNPLAFTLLETMLGSSALNEPLTLNRNLTTIEINILTSTLEAISIDLPKAFTPVIDLNAELLKVENNFRLVNIVDEETEVLVVPFRINSSNQAGEMRFIIPYLTLEPMRERFKEIVTVPQATYTWGKIFADRVLDMEANVVARSGLLNMSVRQILQMQQGDIIDLAYNPDRPLTIVVEDRPKFLAVSGERNGKKAIHITGLFNNRQGEPHGNTR